MGEDMFDTTSMDYEYIKQFYETNRGSTNTMLTLNTTHYDAPKEHLTESLGLLPHWVVEYNMLGESDLVQYMTERYGFGELYRFGGDVQDDGSYKSNCDEDDDLQYVGKMDTKDGTVYFYPYAITALPTDEGYFITRMD
jgi:hypothetical protein